MISSEQSVCVSTGSAAAAILYAKLIAPLSAEALTTTQSRMPRRRARRSRSRSPVAHCQTCRTPRCVRAQSCRRSELPDPICFEARAARISRAVVIIISFSFLSPFLILPAANGNATRSARHKHGRVALLHHRRRLWRRHRLVAIVTARLLRRRRLRRRLLTDPCEPLLFRQQRKDKCLASAKVRSWALRDAKKVVNDRRYYVFFTNITVMHSPCQSALASSMRKTRQIRRRPLSSQ